MPFERYLNPQPVNSDPPFQPQPYQPNPRDLALGLDPSTFSSNIHFHVPNLILGTPTLAPGGGAEVLPPGFIPPAGPLPGASWFANSPFAAPFADNSQHPPKHINYRYSPDLYTIPNALPCPPLSLSYPSPSSRPSPSQSPAFNLPHTPHAHSPPEDPPPLNLPVANAVGLPVYSASGFDLLSILSRVAARPNPRITLGPVDLTCSFVVVDIRRYDSPIVYASPTFCALTGYEEHEVLGRNCRFLQSPDGRQPRGEPRRYTAPEAVAHLKRCAVSSKECQATIINYRKGGVPFINLVTVIPIPGGINNGPDEQDTVVYHVGFQVDLTQQPTAILNKLRDGTYQVDYTRALAFPSLAAAAAAAAAGPSSARNWRLNSLAMTGVSNDLHHLLMTDPAFADVAALASAPTVQQPTPGVSAGAKVDPYDGNRPLHLLLLARAPDPVIVLSLKGAFLYAAPSISALLGHAPEDLVGRSVADFCHPADVVPLMRELKESSVTPAGVGAHHVLPPLAGDSPPSPAGPRKVDMLFRMQTATGTHVWVECRGRLHIEPGKGRKAIILSARVRHMPHLTWGAVERAGGLSAPVLSASTSSNLGSEGDAADGGKDELVEAETEFWALLSAGGTFLFAGTAVRDVLGWAVPEVIGRTMGDFVAGAHARGVLNELAGTGTRTWTSEATTLHVQMKRKDGTQVPVQVVLYRSPPGPAPSHEETETDTASSSSPSGSPATLDSPIAMPASNAATAPIVCQVRLLRHAAPGRPGTAHAPGTSVFDELQLARGSSWQYELQQLKFANQRLAEEVSVIEAALACSGRSHSRSHSHSQSSHPHSKPHHHAHSQSHSAPGPLPASHAQIPLAPVQQQPQPPLTYSTEYDLSDARSQMQQQHIWRSYMPPPAYLPELEAQTQRSSMKRRWDSTGEGEGLRLKAPCEALAEACR